MSEPEQATGLITIIKTPAGEAPEEVRSAWVGLTLPCYPVAGYLSGLELGIKSLKPRDERRLCVLVPQEEALRILAEHAPEAAQWWADHGFPRRFLPRFSFDVDEVRFVSGVRLQRAIEVTDEMQGDPDR